MQTKRVVYTFLILFSLALIALTPGAANAQTPTTTTVTPVADSTLGQTVTFRATVTPAATGRVLFFDGGVAIGSATLDVAGTARFSTAVLSTGSHSITAQYSGDAANNPSVSSALVFTVNARPVNLSMSAVVPSPSSVGDTSKITATVADANVVQPGNFVQWAPTLSTARSNATATLLLDGNVLISGGKDNTGAALASVELLDRSASAFIPLGSGLSTARAAHTATLLQDGTVLVVGGTNGTSELANAEVWDPLTGLFTTLAGTLQTPRSGHTATLLPNGDVLIMGGTSGGTPTNTVELYSPATQTFTVMAGTLAATRSGHSATLLPDGKTILVTGGDAAGTAEVITYNAGSVTTSGVATWTTARVGHSATLLPDGNILIAGGVRAGAPVNTVELYQVPATLVPFPTTFATVTPTVSMYRARAGQTATLLNDAIVMIAGGVDATPTTLNSVEVYVPSFDPTGTVTLSSDDPSDIPVNCTLTMTGSGVTQCDVRVTPTAVNTGSRTLTVNYSGNTNHVSPAAQTVPITVQKGDPDVVWSAPAAIAYGTALSATQLNATSGLPGTYVYSPALGTVLNAGANQTLSVTFTPTDTTNFNSQTLSVTITVDKAPLKITADSKTIVYGSALPTLTASYTGFVNGDTSASLTTQPTLATTATTSSPGGTYPITASGAASPNYNITYADGTLTITATTSSISISAGTPNPSNYGDSVSFTATVTPAAATGTVTFKDGSTTLGTAALTNGVATYSTTALTGGSHASITAVYGGDASYATSTSAAAPAQTVNKISLTGITLSANPTTIYATGQVTYTANVTPTTATGTITFLDQSANPPVSLGTATLSGGKATLSNNTKLTVAGTHNIAARYEGDTNFNSGLVSAPVTITVNAQASTTTITTSSTKGFLKITDLPTPITFTAKVVSTTSGTIPGTVTFTDQNYDYLNTSTKVGSSVTLCNTVALDASGTATCTTSAITTAGQHDIKATYNPPTNSSWATSNSSLSPRLGVMPTGTTPSYKLTVTPGNAIVTTGTSVSVAITIVSDAYFTGTITPSCSGLPTGATCTFSPSSITPTANASTTSSGFALTISTTPMFASAQQPVTSGKGMIVLASFGGMGVFGLLFLGDASRRNRRYTMILLAIMLVLFAVGMTGCGGSSHTANADGTSRGTTTVTLNTVATSGLLQVDDTSVHSATFTLTVQ